MKLRQVLIFPHYIYLVSLLAIIILCPGVAIASAHSKVAINGNTLISTQSGGDNIIKIQIIISQHKVSSIAMYKDAWVWGGGDGYVPSHCLSGIKLKINREIIILPFSSYADLGDVSQASVEYFKGGFDIEINGGRSSYSYTATLRFRGDDLISRAVVLNAFPMQRREITSYSYTKVAN